MERVLLFTVAISLREMDAFEQMNISRRLYDPMQSISRSEIATMRREVDHLATKMANFGLAKSKLSYA